ncbi:MAG: substrate-binding domain-containing protein [Lachnospiraceae bacterium]|nr:substrate-binding domain-containing protein [Lachnospiraceae bacterium]
MSKIWKVSQKIRPLTHLCVIIIILLMTGCGGDADKPKEVEKKDDGKIQIGMSFDSFVIERWQRDRDVFVATARDLGAEVNVQSANGEVDKQISQITYFINKGVDAIVVVPIDADALTEVIVKAKKAGIPVMCYDRLVKNANADLYISFDNEKVGDLMGRAIYDKLGKNRKILEVCGPESDNNVEQVAKGFEYQSRRNAAQIIGTCHCEGWKSEIAYEYINDNEDLVSKADGIMCGNDALAGVVIKALSEMRLAGKVVVVGQDADLEACQRVVEGTQEMTVYKPVENLAKSAAEYAVSLAKGEEIKTATGFNDGTYDVPFIKLQPIAVTKGNMDETIISSGYHLREDVYINVTE